MITAKIVEEVFDQLEKDNVFYDSWNKVYQVDGERLIEMIGSNPGKFTIQDRNVDDGLYLGGLVAGILIGIQAARREYADAQS